MRGASGTPLVLLVVVAEPDERGCTDQLEVVVRALARRDDVDVHVWYLRVVDVPSWWSGAREVDRLRTSPLGRLAALAGPRVAGLVGGARLRAWFRGVDPDVVLLDDGLGGRLLPSAPRRPAVVVRTNPEPPVRPHMEAPPATEADLVLWTDDDPDAEGPGGDALRVPPLLGQARRFVLPDRSGRPVVDWPPDPGVAVADRAVEARAELRERIGVPDAPLVVGWGDDGWLDGADHLVRSLWYLEDRHGVVAHAAWIGLAGAPEMVDRLHQEAERCGVTGRFHHVAHGEPGLEWGGDVAFLPYRVPADPEVLLDCGSAGLPVVAFAPTLLDAPWVAEVPLLDVEGAASALVRALHRGRAETQRELDVDLWVEELLRRLRALPRS